MKRYFKEGAWVYCSLTGQYGWINHYLTAGQYEVFVKQNNFITKNWHYDDLIEMKIDVNKQSLSKMYIEMALLSGDKEWFDQLIGKGDSNEAKQLT